MPRKTPAICLFLAPSLALVLACDGSRKGGGGKTSSTTDTPSTTGTPSTTDTPSATDTPATTETDPKGSPCEVLATQLNQQFATIADPTSHGLATDSGVLVHTIHGPGTGPEELDLAALEKLTPEPDKTCGAFLNAPKPLFLPWCGSNEGPSGALVDASSWTYIRQDTMRPAPAGADVRNEVVCDPGNNRRYGLVFSLEYLNEGDHLGCMYPLDGDSGHRDERGCGTNESLSSPLAKGPCPATMDLAQYLKAFNGLLVPSGTPSEAGSLVCSLSKAQFELWVEARQKVDLSHTEWSESEFVVFDWSEYSANDLAEKGYLIGFYYVTGCADGGAGNAKDAKGIADLYEHWTGVALPVVDLSNAAMRTGNVPFSCPT